MDPSASTDPVGQALSAFFTPLGFIVAFLALAMALTSLFSPKARWFIFGMLMWTSALGSGQVDATESFTAARLMFPLESLRENGRTITSALLLSLLAPSLFAPRGWRRQLVLGGSVAFLVYELLFALRIAGAGMYERAFTAIPTYALLFTVVAVGLSRWLQSPADAYSALRTVAFSGLVFAFTNVVQYMVDPSAVSIHGRFAGTAGNPQHAATCIAAIMPALLALVMRKEEPKFVRFVFAGTAAVLLTFIVMTGSRTGLLMLLAGIVLLCQKRLGRGMKIVGAVALGLMILAVAVFSGGTSTVDRLLSIEDTRSAVWSESWHQFTDHPLTGQMDLVVGVRETSYLSTAARTGLVGLIPMAIAFLLITKMLLRIRKVRPQLGEHAVLVDVATAGMVSLWVGAVSEGYLLAVLSIHLVLLYMYISLSGFILDSAEAAIAPAEQLSDEAAAYAAWNELAYSA